MSGATGILQGQVVIVTGAGRGIGRDIALAMAAAGARVVVNDIGAAIDGHGRDAGPARAVADEIAAAGGTAMADGGSVADHAACERMVQAALQAWGRVDAVVNNAGILRDRLVHKMTHEEWQAVIDVNLTGVFNVSRAAAEVFRRQESGSYVHLTSTAGLIGNTGQANYGAAKAGVAALSRTLATDLARFNVRSNCIAPFAFTRMVDSIRTDTPEMAAKVALARRMESRQVAPMAVYLASALSQGVTGQVFAVRANELILMGQPRPLRSVHHGEGWTAESIAQIAEPAMRPHFYGLDKSADVFNWPPI
ncbi:SDR family oxidoreductase [Pseudorhodoferax sp.]|uniref:SDR family oxidoreductase n=1 Tax=Pseudorhodoferax sp. TaxID=1993553 RepID=UPI002DD61919|nr:SDR family oxidoreductase [Pseudorhodoferax sp.]